MNKVNTKVFHRHARKACRRHRVIAPLNLTLVLGGDEWSTPYSSHFTLGKNQSTNCIAAIMDVVGMNVRFNERMNE
jgi:hypothetical protein